MASNYRLQIVHIPSGGVVVEWPPGLHQEHDLIDEIVERVRSRGVGLFQTEEHVTRDVRAAIEDLLYELKLRV